MLDEWCDVQLFSRTGSTTLIMLTHCNLQNILVCNNSTGNLIVSYLFIDDSKLSTPLSIKNL